MSAASKNLKELMLRKTELYEARKRIRELEDLLPHDAKRHDRTCQKNEDYRTRLKALTIELYEERQKIAELEAENSKLQNQNFAHNEKNKIFQEFPELVEPTRETRLARTVVRIVEDFDESSSIERTVEAVVPSWDPNQIATFSARLVPEALRSRLRKDAIFFARVNTGADQKEDLRFSDFELAPEHEPICIPTVWLTPEGQKQMEERQRWLNKACEAEDGCVSVGGLAHDLGMLDPDYIKESEERMREQIGRMIDDATGKEYEYDIPSYKDALHDAELRIKQLEEELLELYEDLLLEGSYQHDNPEKYKDWLCHSFMSNQEHALKKLVDAGVYELHPERPALFRKKQ